MKRQNPKHSYLFLVEHQPDKLERMVEAGNKLREKFLSRSFGKYILLKLKVDGFVPYTKYIIIRNIDKGLEVLDIGTGLWREAGIESCYAPFHTSVDLRFKAGISKFGKLIHRINIEKLFSKTDDENQGFYFDDEESLLLYYECIKNGV